MIQSGQRYLVNTDNWFVAPDGQQYRAAWGTCTLCKTEDVLGFTPARPSTNWWMRVGDGEAHVLIAGCQIYFVVRCADVPKDTLAGTTYPDKDSGLSYNGSRIYLAEG